MITCAQILEGAAVGEGTDWELESAKGGLPGSLWATYSAVANSEGGTIVLGARERDDGKIALDGLSPKWPATLRYPNAANRPDQAYTATRRRRS